MMDGTQGIVVSVIVLTYDHASTIGRALESILAQEVEFPYEVLVGDDGSTDGTAEIVRAYADRCPQRIVPVLRKENIGATKNLYDLLQRAKGIYIANLEGDDRWTDPKKLQAQVRFLDEHPRSIGCCHRCRVVDGYGAATETPRWICEKPVFTMKDFRGIYLPGHPSTWVYRNIYREARYDYSIIWRAHTLIADRTIAFLLLAQGDFACLPETMSCYRSIDRPGGKNATSMLFAGQIGSKYMELRLTQALERWAKSELGRDVAFTAFKWRLFASALVKSLLRPGKESWRCIKNMIAAAIEAKVGRSV